MDERIAFSISAGVGFIALLVLRFSTESYWLNILELKHQGMKSIDELILKGTTDRLRPVLLTASAAALGFYPWHYLLLQERRQRPLATVVIGGLLQLQY
jgi:cobalt-zinc-cadmium resistance protein CzcA